MFKAPRGLSKIAFGVSGPLATPLVSERATTRLIHTAVKGGITAFDTGPSYGTGEAERRLGRALKGLDREQVFVSTKVGISENKTRDFSPQAIRSSLDRSLARLGCDYVDAVFVHGPDASELNKDLAQVLLAEKQSGRARLLGITGRGDELDAALDLGIFDLFMAPVHAELSNKATKRLVRARSEGLGVFGIEMLKGASAGLRWPRSAADLWYCARALHQRQHAAPTCSVREALKYGVCDSAADVVMLLTTRQRHLQEALRVLDETALST